MPHGGVISPPSPFALGFGLGCLMPTPPPLPTVAGGIRSRLLRGLRPIAMVRIVPSGVDTKPLRNADFDALSDSIQ